MNETQKLLIKKGARYYQSNDKDRHRMWATDWEDEAKRQGYTDITDTLVGYTKLINQ